MFGVTNFSQSARLAWFYLNQANLCNKWVKFKTNRLALDRTVGDVIALDNHILGEVKLYRIVNMVEAEGGRFELTCRIYNPDIYNDTLAAQKPLALPYTANPFQRPDLTRLTAFVMRPRQAGFIRRK